MSNPTNSNQNSGPNFAICRLTVGQKHIPDAVCISKTVVFRRNCSLSPEIWAWKKLTLGVLNLQSYFLPCVDQSSPNYVDWYRTDPSLQRHFPIKIFSQILRVARNHAKNWLLGCKFLGGYLSLGEVSISKHWSSSTNCEIFRRERWLRWASQKVDFGGSKLLFYFLPSVDQSSPNSVYTHKSDRSLQCHFPIDDFLFQSGDIHNQGMKLSEITLKFWCFWAAKFFWGKYPQISNSVL